jgi:hypothetical protein
MVDNQSYFQQSFRSQLSSQTLQQKGPATGFAPGGTLPFALETYPQHQSLGSVNHFPETLANRLGEDTGLYSMLAATSIPQARIENGDYEEMKSQLERAESKNFSNVF